MQVYSGHLPRPCPAKVGRLPWRCSRTPFEAPTPNPASCSKPRSSGAKGLPTPLGGRPPPRRLPHPRIRQRSQRWTHQLPEHPAGGGVARGVSPGGSPPGWGFTGARRQQSGSGSPKAASKGPGVRPGTCSVATSGSLGATARVRGPIASSWSCKCASFPAASLQLPLRRRHTISCCPSSPSPGKLHIQRPFFLVLRSIADLWRVLEEADNLFRGQNAAFLAKLKGCMLKCCAGK